MLWLWITLAVVVILLATTIHHYNRFKVLGNRCDESWSNVDTELQRRHNLIPNLVASVQGYAKHERGLQTAITEARTLAGKRPTDAADANELEAQLGARMNKLLMVAEKYPDLKASKNFLQLQEELAITEDRIQAARRFYNGNVRDQHNTIEQFPGVLFAKIFGPTKRAYFEVDAAVKASPRVEM